MRGRWRSQSNEVQRASRAMPLVQVGELSVLTDLERRPPVPREAVSDRVSRATPSLVAIPTGS